ncbi:MFS transporter [Paraburkholderia unamae]|uniref:MFS transporter n=1 Tax=Paraburkholderia unamae TaxID=219649 RepID=A0ACC6RF47_9BURK
MNEIAASRTGSGVGANLYRGWFLLLLTLIYASNFVDRIIIAVVGQAMKIDLGLTDLQLGLLGGLAFSLFYAVLGLPIARLADRFNRVTLIAVCVAIWSAMTALCGTAGAYGQLLLYRLGVGIGEGGSLPTAHSLISDQFGPRRRAIAMAIFGLGAPLGVLAGALGGGWMVEHMGWRPVFVVVGLPGLVFGLLAWITLREPKRGAAEDDGELTGAQVPPLRRVVSVLVNSRPFVHMLLGTVIGGFAQFGINMFIPIYLVRVFGMSFAQAGLAFGLVIGIGGILGNLLGGISADLAGATDRRWYAWVPALGTATGFVLIVAAFTMNAWPAAVALLFVATIALSTWTGPTFAIAHSVVEPRMRATASAFVFLLMNLVGQGLGPTAIGFLSDRFAGRLFAQGNYHLMCAAHDTHGAHGAAEILQGSLGAVCRSASAYGVRYAMLAVSLVLAWSAAHYFLASRHMSRNK